MNSLNVEQIQEIIPHRHPFLLIDKIEDYVPGEYAIGYKVFLIMKISSVDIFHRKQ